MIRTRRASLLLGYPWLFFTLLSGTITAPGTVRAQYDVRLAEAYPRSDVYSPYYPYAGHAPELPRYAYPYYEPVPPQLAVQPPANYPTVRYASMSPAWSGVPRSYAPMNYPVGTYGMYGAGAQRAYCGGSTPYGSPYPVYYPGFVPGYAPYGNGWTPNFTGQVNPNTYPDTSRYYIGFGAFGQPRAFSRDEPVQNFFRYFLP